MNNDTKNILMQYLYRFADHYEITEAALTSFKKRSDLFDKLRVKNNEAWLVITELFDAFVKFDRIENDKEKFDKARVLWESEHATSEKEKVTAEMHLIKFCKEHAIPVGGLTLAQ